MKWILHSTWGQTHERAADRFGSPAPSRNQTSLGYGADANAELTHVLTQDYPTFESTQFQ